MCVWAWRRLRVHQSARTLELEGKVASLQKQLEQAEFEAAEALAKMKLATQRQDW